MRLQITYAGRWYIGLSALLAGVCGISANNVVYLLESILVASLLVSLVAAYRASLGVTIEYRRHPAICGAQTTDQMRVTNRASVSRYCLELGEWAAGRFAPLAFVPRVPPRGAVLAPCRRVFAHRGRYEWRGVAVASSYPFGLFRLVRYIPAAGSRIVWPARALSAGLGTADAGNLSSLRAGTSVVEGEIRPMAPDDDWRSVVWTLSARGGDPVVRARGAEQEDPAVVVDLRGARRGPELERKISAAASLFYAAQPMAQAPDGARGGTLVLIDDGGRRRFEGAGPSLDQLALVAAPPEEGAA